MTIDWNAILDRYGNGAEVGAVVGTKKFTITGADDRQIFFKSRLWSDELPRDRLDHAMALLESGELNKKATEFLESYRLHVEKDDTVPQGCSRLPNMVAVVLKDLGFLTTN